MKQTYCKFIVLSDKNFKSTLREKITDLDKKKRH